MSGDRMIGKPTALVVDASVSAKWHLNDEEFSDQATVILEQFAAGELELWAPDHIRYEVPAAISMATLGRQPRLTVQQGQEAIQEFLALGLQTTGDDDLILSAYALVHRFGCALYDGLYLALAQRLAIPFVTADRKFYRRIHDLPDVVWIADYPE